MKPSWSDVAVFYGLLFFALVMAYGWPPITYAFALVGVLLLMGFIFFVKNKSNSLDFVRICSVRDFSFSHDNYGFAVVRVPKNKINNIHAPQIGKFKRRQWVKIYCCKTKKYIYRKALGGEDLGTDKIELDYDSLLELGRPDLYGGSNFKRCDFLIYPAVGIIDFLLAHWKHPSEIYRAPMRVAAISLLVSLFGVIYSIFA